MAKEKPKIKTHVSDAKKKTLKELTELIKNKNTILLASIKNLPASQFQETTKKVRGKAIVKVPRKNLMLMAIDNSEKESLKKLKEQIESDVAILFSDEDAFELASFLIENKSPAKAKVGQEAKEDIVIPAGPTSLVPGPAISELGAMGIQIQIDKGKINIKEPKVIAKKGEKISQGAADIMSKLDIKPFSIGFIPMCAFDSKEGKIYLNIQIDKEGTLEKLKSAFGKSLAFAVEIGYPSKDTIKFLIGKAGMHERALRKLIQTPEINSESPKTSEDETSSGEGN